MIVIKYDLYIPKFLLFRIIFIEIDKKKGENRQGEESSQNRRSTAIRDNRFKFNERSHNVAASSRFTNSVHQKSRPV